ncbi:hypothetical protein HJC23_008869, partial [Cyclotella cryptica]
VDSTFFPAAAAVARGAAGDGRVGNLFQRPTFHFLSTNVGRKMTADPSENKPSPNLPTKRRHRITMVCDFFYPRLGGVEMHIWLLSYNLLNLGHKVIVITHACNSPTPKYHARIEEQENRRLIPPRRTESVLLPVFAHGRRRLPSDIYNFVSAPSLDFHREGIKIVLKATLSTVGAAICASHTCRDNFILRAHMLPSIVHEPGIIPPICRAFPNVDFLIGGDGNKKLSLEEMVERERLHDRVEFLDYVPHSSVRDVLVRGNVFLNCSLTESFCIAILEAASAGLVPEVLPPDMIHLADPNVDSLVESLSCAISGKIDSTDPFELHRRVSQMYSWQRVASETVTVHDRRLVRYKTVGRAAGFVVCLLGITLHFVVLLVEWWQPQHLIDVVPDLCIDKNQKHAHDKENS